MRKVLFLDRGGTLLEPPIVGRPAETADQVRLVRGVIPALLRIRAAGYELVVYNSVDPSSGLRPSYRRFRFSLCTEACVRSTVPPLVWARSTDDRLLSEHHVTMESSGYVWGVECQLMYPGASVVEDSGRAKFWHEQLGIPFHEVLVEANAHAMRQL